MYRIDHDKGRHDDRVISLALVAHRLAKRPAGRGRFGGLVAARTRNVPWTTWEAPEQRPFLPLPRCNAAGQGVTSWVARGLFSGLVGLVFRRTTGSPSSLSDSNHGPRQLVPVLLPAHLLDQQRPGSAALHTTVVRHRRQPFQSQRATLATSLLPPLELGQAHAGEPWPLRSRRPRPQRVHAEPRGRVALFTRQP